jgi:hypothetical protein
MKIGTIQVRKTEIPFSKSRKAKGMKNYAG